MAPTYAPSKEERERGARPHLQTERHPTLRHFAATKKKERGEKERSKKMFCQLDLLQAGRTSDIENLFFAFFFCS